MVLEQVTSKIIQFNLLPTCKGSYEGREMYRTQPIAHRVKVTKPTLHPIISALPSTAMPVSLRTDCHHLHDLEKQPLKGPPPETHRPRLNDHTGSQEPQGH